MDPLQLLHEFVAIPTVSDMSPRPLADRIANYLADSGADVEILSYPGSGDGAVEKVTVYATVGPRPPILMLAGHMDTVPSSNDWVEPYKVRQIGQTLVGLGVTDMKCFLAHMIIVAGALREHSLRQGIAFAFTHDEEIGLRGARRLVETLKARNELSRYAIAGEPTEMVPMRAHKGYMSLKATIRGRAGHSSNPIRGINSIYRANRAIDLLTHYSLELMRVEDDRFNPPYATLNVGAIAAGPDHRPNIIPDQCELYLDVRPLPGQSPAAIFAEIKRRLGTIDEFATFGSEPAQSLDYVKPPTPSMETPSGSPIVQVAEAVCGLPSGGVSFTTEATVYNQAGIESIVLGPGNIAQAHTKDEFISVEWLSAHELLSEIALRLSLERTEPLMIANRRRIGSDKLITAWPEKVVRRQPHLIPPETRAETIEAVLRFAARYQDRLIVVKADWQDDAIFAGLLSDLAQLKAVGFSLILVVDLTETMTTLGFPLKFRAGIPVARPELLPRMEALIEQVTQRLETRGTADHSGLNLVLYPMGLLRSRRRNDQTITSVVGLPVKVDARYLEGVISNGGLPTLLPIGKDESGNRYLLSAEELAGLIARQLKAEKLILMSPFRGIFLERRLVSEITPAELQTKLGRLNGRIGLEAKVGLETARAGVPRIHLIHQGRGRALLVEIFTEAGHGTMIVADPP